MQLLYRFLKLTRHFKWYLASLTIKSPPPSIRARSSVSYSSVIIDRILLSASNVDTRWRSPSSCPFSQNKQLETLMHLSSACPTTPLMGLDGAIARRLQQICRQFVPSIGDFDNSNKMIEKVKVCTFSEQVKGVLARSSGTLTSLSLRKPWKAIRLQLLQH